MAFTSRDVIVYLSEYPWQFLVKNHNGDTDRSIVTDYYRGKNYRNTLVSGDALFLGPVDNDIGTKSGIISPPATLTSPLNSSADVQVILGDAAAAAAGVTGSAPRPDKTTRVRMYFGVTDIVTTTDSPYSCWEDEFRGLGDVDTTGALD